MQIKNSILVLCLIITSLVLKAQDTTFVKVTKSEKKEFSKEEKKAYKKSKHQSVIRYIYVGSGYGSSNIRDEMTSPLRYSGGHFGGFAKYYHKTDRYIFQISSTAMIGQMGNSFHKEEKGTLGPMSSFISINRFDYWVPIRKVLPNSWYWLVGGSSKNITWIRQNNEFTNSAFNFDLLGTLAASSRIERIFNWRKSNRKMKISYDIAIPIFSTISRKPYNGISESEDFLESFNENVNAGFFKVFDLSMNTELTYYFKNGNQLVAIYTWNYYGYNPGYNSVKGAAKGLFLSLVIKLDRNEEFTAF